MSNVHNGTLLAAAAAILTIGPLLSPWPARGDSLGALQVEPDGNVLRFSVSNVSATNVNLRGSFNLTDWFILQSSQPVGGRASFTFTNSESVNGWFFRAVAEPPAVNINVGPQVDTNLSVAVVMLPETGGELEISDQNGVSYSLSFTSNLVTTPTLVRMTVVTNFASMPYTNDFRAAVAFEPDGLELEGEAELRIRFPGPVPQFEMLGYGFDGSGGNLHLRLWETSSNEVRMGISHFSGAGVAAVPFPLTPSSQKNYDQAYRYTGDIIRITDDWAGKRYREKLQDRKEGRITPAELSEWVHAIKDLRERLIYVNAIKPLFAAIEQDCSVGEVILRRIKQLGPNTVIFTKSYYLQELREAALRIRCTCSKFYLDFCERDAGASGINATEGLQVVLDRVAQITGPVAGNSECELGSDTDIMQRLARAKCHKPWEGSVRYMKAFVSGITNELPGTDSWLNLVKEETTFTYEGWIQELVQEEGDGGLWQAWTFKLSGKLNAAELRLDKTRYVTQDYIMTDVDQTTAAARLTALGQLMVRFDKGEFSWASASAGLGVEEYSMPLLDMTERQVRCFNSGSCPKAIPPEYSPGGTRELSFADSANRNNDQVTFSWDPQRGVLKASVVRRTRELYEPPIVGTHDTFEKMDVYLLRAAQ